MTSEGPLAHLREHEDVIERDLRLILGRCRAGARLLDVGAGRGSFVRAANRRGLRAIALDMQPEASGVWQRDGVAGVVGSGAALPFAAATLDVVRMKEVLEHVEDPLALCHEAKRLLVAGGIFVAHVPTPYSQLYPVGNFWDDYTHVRPFSRMGLRRLIADSGLDLVKIDAYVSGRNHVERALGSILARIFPHIYRLVAIRA